jgi:hypothetical protein
MGWRPYSHFRIQLSQSSELIPFSIGQSDTE